MTRKTNRSWTGALAARLFFLCLMVLSASIIGCGGGGGGGDGSTTGSVWIPSIAVLLPTTNPASWDCDTGRIHGEADVGRKDCSWGCSGMAVERTGIRVSWRNTTSGDSGQAVQDVREVGLTGLRFLKDHTWYADFPLVLGNNEIEVTATDIETGRARTVRQTVNKPVLTYTVSGSFTSDLGAPPNGARRVEIRAVSSGKSYTGFPNGANGEYRMTCVRDGTYTLTPSSTIDYAFTPAIRVVNVTGADVVGQNFTAPAFTISGRVAFASNPSNGVQGQGISLSGSGSTAWTSTGASGNYRFLVPNGSYTILPVDIFGKPEGTTPTSRSVTINSADVGNQDFQR